MSSGIGSMHFPRSSSPCSGETNAALDKVTPNESTLLLGRNTCASSVESASFLSYIMDPESSSMSRVFADEELRVFDDDNTPIAAQSSNHICNYGSNSNSGNRPHVRNRSVIDLGDDEDVDGESDNNANNNNNNNTGDHTNDHHSNSNNVHNDNSNENTGNTTYHSNNNNNNNISYNANNEEDGDELADEELGLTSPTTTTNDDDDDGGMIYKHLHHHNSKQHQHPYQKFFLFTLMLRMFALWEPHDASFVTKYIWPAVVLLIALFFKVAWLVMFELGEDFQILESCMSLFLIVVDFVFFRWFLKRAVLPQKLRRRRLMAEKREIRNHILFYFGMFLVLMVFGLAMDGFVVYEVLLTPGSPLQTLGSAAFRGNKTLTAIMWCSLLFLSDFYRHGFMAATFVVFWLTVHLLINELRDYRRQLIKGQLPSVKVAIHRHARLMALLETTYKSLELFLVVAVTCFICNILTYLYSSYMTSGTEKIANVNGLVYYCVFLLLLLLPCGNVTAECRKVPSVVNRISATVDEAYQDAFDSFLLYLQTANGGFKMMGVEISIGFVTKVALALFTFCTFITQTLVHAP